MAKKNTANTSNDSKKLDVLFGAMRQLDSALYVTALKLDALIAAIASAFPDKEELIANKVEEYFTSLIKKTSEEVTKDVDNTDNTGIQVVEKD